MKSRAEVAGLDPAIFSGHNLRGGFVTASLLHRADILRVMDVTRRREVSRPKFYDRRVQSRSSGTRARLSCNIQLGVAISSDSV